MDASPEYNSSSLYPPKPHVIETRQNSVLRTLLNLLLYGLMFYFLFDQNIVYISAILLVLIIHELGHFFLMRLYGYQNVKMFIIPLLGAVTTGNKQKVSQTQLVLIILAGPVPGILIGSLLYWFNQQWDNDTVRMLYQSFLFINLLNLLPFHPLDGGRLVESLFFRENYIIRQVFGILSIIALVLLFLLQQNFFLLIIPFLIGIELRNEFKNQKIREYLKQENINTQTDYPGLPDKDYWLIRDCIILSNPRKYGVVQAGVYAYSPLESILVQHVTSVLQVYLVNDMKAFAKLVVLLFYLSMFLLPLLLYIFN